MEITAKQCKAARALLDWNQQDLANASGVGIATIRSFEKTKNPTTPQRGTMALLINAFNEAGAFFIEEHNLSIKGGKGVRLVTEGNAYHDTPSQTYEQLCSEILRFVQVRLIQNVKENKLPPTLEELKELFDK